MVICSRNHIAMSYGIYSQPFNRNYILKPLFIVILFGKEYSRIMAFGINCPNIWD